ncbi:MAG: hypothetical protein AB4368_08840 [Xenococcaceae cyanobacterium]
MKIINLINNIGIKSLHIWLTSLLFSVIIPSQSAKAATIELFFDAFIPDARAINSAADVLPPFYTSFIGDDRGFDILATQKGYKKI